MKKLYNFKKNIKWRKEKNSLLFLHPQDKKLLVFNKEIAKYISPKGIIESNDKNYNFINFLKKINAISEIAKNQPAPLSVTIQITNKCNLKCTHCHNNKHKQIKTISTTQYKELINELSNLNVFNITISGGEPLTLNNIVEIVEYPIKKGMNCVMSTNLTLLNSRIATKLAKAGLAKVNISFDSFDQLVHDKIRGVKGSFEKMKNNLQILIKNNIQYTLVTTLVNQSPDQYEKTIDLAYKLGAKIHKTNTVIPQGRSKSSDFTPNKIDKYRIKEYIEIWKNKKNQYAGKMEVNAETMFAMQIKEEMTNNTIPKILKTGCPAGILTCAINESGDVIPCSYFSEMIVGNIFKNSFIEIWNNDFMVKFRDRNNITVCGTCKNKSNCGGCRARSYGQTGKFDQADLSCFLNL